MAAIGGTNLGMVTGYALMDQVSGEIKTFTELFAGGAGQKGDKGDKGEKGDTGAAGAAGAKGAAGNGVTAIAAARSGNTVTLTFTLSDNTTQTASFDIPASA